jgi:hypothetical protein
MNRLPSALQERNLRHLFTENNPEADPQEIDFKAVIGDKENYAETLEAIRVEYPHFKWGYADDDYKDQAKSKLMEEAKTWGFEVVPTRELSKLRRDAEALTETTTKLKLTELAVQKSEAKASPPPKPVAESTLDLIKAGLRDKPLLIIGARSAGKTVMAKQIVGLVNGEYQVRVFDPSLVWWRGSPLKTRYHVPAVADVWVPNLVDAVYDIGGIDGARRAELITLVIGSEYTRRYQSSLHSPATKLIPDLTVVEEGQSSFNKWDKLSEPIHDWVSVGRNYGMSGIVITQRPAEIDTKIVERCNLLVGYIEGHNNFNKIKGATDGDFIKKVKKLENGSHDFLYWDGRAHHVKVDEPTSFGEPVNYLNRPIRGTIQ